MSTINPNSPGAKFFAKKAEAEAFIKKYDSNGNGYVNGNELRHYYQNGIIKKYDTNKDGEVSRDEYGRNTYDTNNDGRVSKNETPSVGRKVRVGDIIAEYQNIKDREFVTHNANELLSMMDRNKDGSISLAEAIYMMSPDTDILLRELEDKLK